MLFGQDRDQLRRFYCQAWQKHCQRLQLEPLEIQLVSVIKQHPEYHPLLEDADSASGKEYLPENGETNPFLHMGMHLAIHEQLATDLPAGIRHLYHKLSGLYKDEHELEHRIMECLAEMIWQSQRAGTPPDELAYLECLSAIGGFEPGKPSE